MQQLLGNLIVIGIILIAVLILVSMLFGVF